MRASMSCVLPMVFGASLVPAAVLAAEATAQGAEDVKAVIQTYLGATEGVVSVEASGSSYAVALDFAPLFAKLPQGATAEASLLEFSLTEQDNGTWAIAQDQAFSLRATAPDAADIRVEMGQVSASGVFDPVLGAFSSSAGKISDFSLVENLNDPQLGRTDVTYTIASLTYESAAQAGAAGGVDTKDSFTLNDLSETFTLPQMGLPLTLRAEVVEGNSAITGLRPDAIYKLVAFFVANPDKAAIALEQDRLKTIISDAIPLFDHLSSGTTTSTISLETPFGPASATSIAMEVEANGIAADGMLREAIRLEGLALPPAIVPEWAVDLVPQSFAFDLTLSNFDLAAPTRMLLGLVDLANPDASLRPEDYQALMSALLPQDVIKIALAPAGITAPIYWVSYEGEMTAGQETGAGAKAVVTASGMTAVKQALGKAPPEIGQQAAPILAMAEGMAKPGSDGSLVWELEARPTGEMFVNGVDLMGMGGGN